MVHAVSDRMTDATTILLVLIPALPLGASIVTALLGARMLKDNSHVPVVVCLVAAFVASLMLLSQVHGAGPRPSCWLALPCMSKARVNHYLKFASPLLRLPI